MHWRWREALHEFTSTGRVTKLASRRKKQKVIKRTLRSSNPVLSGAAAPSDEFNDTPHRLTPEKQDQFLTLYAKGRSIESAANEIGFSRIAIYALQDRDEAFAERMEGATKQNTRSLADHLLRHATERGVPGNIIALFGILKARDPATWRENVKMDVQGTITHAVAPSLLNAARERLAARDVAAPDTTARLPAPVQGVPKH